MLFLKWATLYFIKTSLAFPKIKVIVLGDILGWMTIRDIRSMKIFKYSSGLDGYKLLFSSDQVDYV
jgi:hypothetical protein